MTPAVTPSREVGAREKGMLHLGRAWVAMALMGLGLELDLGLGLGPGFG